MKSLYTDVKLNPRKTEDSRIVIGKWTQAVDPYLPEIPNVEPDNEEKRKVYLDITAERLLFRKKLLGLAVDEGLTSDEHVLTAHPFGDNNPTFKDLFAPAVRIAAALIPLTPEEDKTKRPVMARLYCVSGLTEGRYATPFRDGVDESHIRDFFWFVAGVNNDDLKNGISGRSWLLAASLLVQIIGNADRSTARNLISNYIVTGDVVNGEILHVEMGKKIELVKRGEFRNLKWIVPVKNKGDMINMKVECPQTIEAAYEIIKTLCNHATNALIELSRTGGANNDAILHNMKAGADPSRTDIRTGQNARQLLWASFAAEFSGKLETILKCGEIREVGSCVAVQEIVDMLQNLLRSDRMMSYYGDSPQMFFMFAHAGRNDMVGKLADVFDINATDSSGGTALDFAVEVGDSLAADILRGAGATRRGVYEAESDKMKNAIMNLRSESLDDRASAIQHVKAAMEYGLSPNCKIRLVKMDETEWEKIVWLYNDETEAVIDEDGQFFDKHDYKRYVCRRRRCFTTIFLEAVLVGNIDLVNVCMSFGGDINATVPVAVVEKLSDEVFERSGREPVTHDCKFDDNEFHFNGTLSVREILKDTNPEVKRNTAKIRKMLRDNLDK